MGREGNITGAFFEWKLFRAVEGLQDTRHASNTPDGLWNPAGKEGRVWIEAKAALDHSGYGCIPKQYQFAMHETHAPMIYAFGYHDFAQARNRLAGRTQANGLSVMKRSASITRMFLISSCIVEQMWERDKKVSEKNHVEYRRVSPGNLQQIILDKNLRRSGETHNARDYYGLPECRFRDARPLTQPLGYILTESDYLCIQPKFVTINWEILFGKPRN